MLANPASCSDYFTIISLTFTNIPFLIISSTFNLVLGRRGGLLASTLHSRSRGPGSSPGRDSCVVFLGKTHNSHSTSLRPGV